MKASILVARWLRPGHDARDVRILSGLEIGLLSLRCCSLGATLGL